MLSDHLVSYNISDVSTKFTISLSGSPNIARTTKLESYFVLLLLKNEIKLFLEGLYFPYNETKYMSQFTFWTSFQFQNAHLNKTGHL